MHIRYTSILSRLRVDRIRDPLLSRQPVHHQEAVFLPVLIALCGVTSPRILKT